MYDCLYVTFLFLPQKMIRIFQIFEQLQTCRKLFPLKQPFIFPLATVPRIFGAVAVLAVLCNFPLFPGFALCIAASHPPSCLNIQSKNQAYCLKLNLKQQRNYFYDRDASRLAVNFFSVPSNFGNFSEYETEKLSKMEQEEKEPKMYASKEVQYAFGPPSGPVSSQCCSLSPVIIRKLQKL